MAHFGMLCPEGTGHLNSLIPLGQELQKRGHRVTIFQFLDFQEKVLASGLGFQSVSEADFPLGSIPQRHAELGELSGLAAIRYSVQFFQDMIESRLRHAPEVIQKAGVDALIVDQTSMEGGTIADLLGIPFVTFCSAVVLNQEPSIPPFITNWRYSDTPWAGWRNRLGYYLLDRLVAAIPKTIRHYRHQWGLPPYTQSGDPYSKLAQISQQPAEFEYPRQCLPDCFHFTGPHHTPAARESTPFPFEQLTGQPLIYASMGTLQNRQAHIFESIARACADLPVQLVISLGNRDRPIPQLPGSPLVVPYAPQLELLQRATLTVTHAGLNTTLESLRYGVPMVAIPIANDQPAVAARIAWSGAGIMLPPERLTVPKLRRAIQQVLTQDRYRQNAQRLQTAIARSGGVTQAADIVEQVVGVNRVAISV